MNVNLTAEQLQAVKDGTMVHLSVPEFEMDCVVVRADLCGHRRGYRRHRGRCRCRASR